MYFWHKLLKIWCPLHMNLTFSTSLFMCKIYLLITLVKSCFFKEKNKAAQIWKKNHKNCTPRKGDNFK